VAVKLNPIFKQIFTTKKRYIVLTGGRGSSKSFGLNTAAVLMSYEAGHKILHTRVSMSTAEDSIIPEFQEKIHLLEVDQDFQVFKGDITNKISGSKFLFRGIKTASGDQTAKLKSIPHLSDWFLDEAEELLDEKKFDDIDFSVRGAGAQNRIVLILNPTTKEHWIWKRWFENHLRYVDIDGFKIPVSDHPDILHIHTTYLDNPHLPAQFVEQMRKLKFTDPDKYKHVVLGGWLEKAEGVVFPNWEEGQFSEYFPYVHALDFGFSPDPLALVKVSVNRRDKIIYAKEKVYETELGTEEVVKSVRNAIDHKNDLIMCDTSENRLFAELKRSGLNVAMVSKKNTTRGGSIKNDIRDITDYKLIIDPYSYHLKKELNSYVWDDKKSSTPKDANNHLIDGIRYGFRRLVGYPSAKGIRQMN
jgi:phage terminase large subunit